MALLSKKMTQWRHAMIRPYIYGDVLDLGCGDAVILKDFSGNEGDKGGRYAQKH